MWEEKTWKLRYDKTQKLKVWQNLKYDKFKFMKKKNFKGGDISETFFCFLFLQFFFTKKFHQKTQQPILWWHSKNQIGMKLKNSNCDETQKYKMWWTLKTEIVMKLKKSNGEKTQKLKFWWHLKTQIVVKCENSKGE